jgi:predicted RNase H-like nuclease (RuvC/YqgF family)
MRKLVVVMAIFLLAITITTVHAKNNDDDRFLNEIFGKDPNDFSKVVDSVTNTFEPIAITKHEIESQRKMLEQIKHQAKLESERQKKLKLEEQILEKTLNEMKKEVKYLQQQERKLKRQKYKHSRRKKQYKEKQYLAMIAKELRKLKLARANKHVKKKRVRVTAKPTKAPVRTTRGPITKETKKIVPIVTTTMVNTATTKAVTTTQSPKHAVQPENVSTETPTKLIETTFPPTIPPEKKEDEEEKSDTPKVILNNVLAAASGMIDKLIRAGSHASIRSTSAASVASYSILLPILLMCIL